MSAPTGELPPHLLHVLPNAHSVELIGAFGGKLRHTLVTPDGALPEGLRANSYIKPANDFPALNGMKLPGRMQKLARAMTPFDLVLTNGPNALDVAMAHTMFKDVMNLPALIHHENEPDPKPSLKLTWYRRIALGKSAGIVVPGERLEEAALVDWQQPIGRVKRISPGIDTKAFAKKPKRDGFRLIKHAGEMWVGAWPEGMDAEGVMMLLRAFAEMAPEWQLIILGEDIRTNAVETEIDRLELVDRVYFPGIPRETSRVVGLFDIFVETEPARVFPVHMAEAMAAGVPVLAVRDGEAEHLLAEANREWLFDRGAQSTLAANLRSFAEDKHRRSAIGEANRLRAVQELDKAKTTAAFRRLYASAMKREL
ncbi:glycosyltransferase family 4 protein [Qipengyuania flava]|nr:glycosyltransferase family 4 protein [Qipengyuania flava]